MKEKLAKYEEMLKPENWRVKVLIDQPIYIHVKKPGGLAMGSHQVSVLFKEVASYVPARMDEIDEANFFRMPGSETSYSRKMIIV